MHLEETHFTQIFSTALIPIRSHSFQSDYNDVFTIYILNIDHICLSSWSEKLAGMSEVVMFWAQFYMYVDL